MKKSLKRQNKKAKKRLFKQAAKEGKKLEPITSKAVAGEKESIGSKSDDDEEEKDQKQKDAVKTDVKQSRFKPNLEKLKEVKEDDQDSKSEEIAESDPLLALANQHRQKFENTITVQDEDI